MHRWERRLADLAHLLRTCGAKYFEPDLFRLNLNQFLSTARTVTFLIQKEKEGIPDFAGWYRTNVHEAWADNAIMTWAKEARNHVEKEGDLDMFSQLSLVLIFTHDPRRDIKVNCSRSDLVRASITRLLRFAEKHLPTGIADASIVRIERRWVANTLPDYELRLALTHVYARLHALVTALAKHLGHDLPPGIPDPNSFDELRTTDRQVRYVKFRDRKPATFVSKRVEKVPDYQPPPWLMDLTAAMDPRKGLPGLETQIEFHVRMAEGTFNQFGNHVPMLWLYDEDGQVVDYSGMVPDDQATKFVYWRSVADRVIALRPSSLVWVSEIWIRDHDDAYELPVHKRRIKGEMLQVVGIDRGGNVRAAHFPIVREAPGAKPTLGSPAGGVIDTGKLPNFLLAVDGAFRRLYDLPPGGPPSGVGER